MAELTKETIDKFQATSSKLSINLDKPLCMRDQVAIISDVSGVQRQDVVDILKTLTNSIYFQLMNINLNTVKIDGLITFERVVRKERKAGTRKINGGAEIKIRSQPAKHDIIAKQNTRIRLNGVKINSTCDKKLRQTISKDLAVPAKNS
ncbi:hypothetical protein GCM10011607_11520 [Shewanella inventionis]|uniref:Uncharacterized protein n=1 Tax=Shewanella inventionis TaxID=1738770 RepID=A0ABQ1IWE8_9GAMM|nr:HU family DNA-binding protein [Shewanella inventionis]GGB52706.1 hypothetical protein GCM10011607_11520 [Shewanella inventionis]